MSEKIHFEPTWELPNPFYKADGSITFPDYEYNATGVGRKAKGVSRTVK